MSADSSMMRMRRRLRLHEEPEALALEDVPNGSTGGNEEQRDGSGEPELALVGQELVPVDLEEKNEEGPLFKTPLRSREETTLAMTQREQLRLPEEDPRSFAPTPIVLTSAAVDA